MEFDELLITTGVDALVRLVKEKKRVEISLASQLLDIPQQTLEEWGRILEEEGIIKIEYSLTKIFFTWIEPTAEQIAAEKAEFYEDQKALEEEIKTVRATIEPEIASIETLKKDFSQLYDKLYPKLVELEKIIETMPKASGLPQGYDENFKAIRTRLSEFENAVTSLKSELEYINKQTTTTSDIITKTNEKLEALKNEVEKSKKELVELKEKAKEVSHTIPSEMPAVSEIRKKFEALKTEFADVKKATAVLREDFHNLKEASELLGSIKSSLKEYEEKIEVVKGEVNALSNALADIRKKADELIEKVKEEAEVVNRFADSTKIAKSILTKFPSQNEFSAKLDKLAAREKELEEKLAVFDKLLSSFSTSGAIAVEFERIKNEIDTKVAEMEREMETISKAVDEENTNYATFQKIKERAMISVATYRSQLKEISDEIERLKKETSEASKQIGSEFEKLRERFGQKEIQEILKTAESLKEKKELLDKISASIDSLSNAADNLNKRLIILAKEAEMLKLRASSYDREYRKEKETEIKHQITLTKEEEEEFRKKREELRQLIRKLWEES